MTETVSAAAIAQRGATDTPEQGAVGLPAAPDHSRAGDGRGATHE
jgi:hypothetical protein